MSPWIWAFLIIITILLADWVKIQRGDKEISSSEKDSQRNWNTLLFALGVTALLLNLSIQQRSIGTTNSLSPYLAPLFMLGVSLVSFSLIKGRSVIFNDEKVPETTKSQSSSSDLSLNPKQKLLLLLSLLLVMAAAGPGKLTRFPAFVSIIIWLATIFLSLKSGWDNTTRLAINRHTLLTAGFLFLLALLPRLTYLSQIPNPMYGDEGSFSFSAVEFITGESNNIFTTSWFHFPSLYFFMQSLPIRLLGNTVFAARILSVVAGSITVVAIYFLARQLFDTRVGLIAAILLAANPLHIEFSRIALNNIWDGLSFTLVLGSLWFAWKHNNRNAFLLAGFFLGMSQYFYVTGRLLILLVPVWLVILAYGDSTGWRNKTSHLFFGAAIALVTALPIYWHYLTYPEEFIQVFSRATLLKSGSPIYLGSLTNSLVKGVLAYTHLPLNEYYEADDPILRIGPALFFFLGFLFLLQKRHRKYLGLLTSWLLVLSIATGLSTNSPTAQRMLAATPALNLIVAFGLVTIVDHLKNQWSQAKRFGLSIAIVLAVWVAADDLRFYFFEHTPQWDNGLTSEASFRLGLYVQDHPPSTQVILFTFPTIGYENLLTLRYLAPQVKGINMEDVWKLADNPIIRGEHLVFVFTAQHEDSLKAVQQDYPQGKLLHETYRNDETVYWLYEVGTPSQ